jgi:hypothetical protein
LEGVQSYGAPSLAVGLRKKEPQGAADDKKHQKKQESAWQGYGDGARKGVGIAGHGKMPEIVSKIWGERAHD